MLSPSVLRSTCFGVLLLLLSGVVLLGSASVPDAWARPAPGSGTSAETASTPACPPGTFVPKVRPEQAIGRVEGLIEIDGKLDDMEWSGATRLTGFTEVQPGDQVKPPVCTEVYVAYDDANLYVSFIAYDDDPGSIRASLRNRDQIFQDDWVGIILDPYGDAVQAYEIFVNPLGIQGDLLMSSTGGEDVGFDLVYRSEGRVTEQGFEVEMAIPFSSLRFPAQPVQEWRINFIRTRPRSSRQQFAWASVDRDDPCFMCQFGTITGLQGIQPSTNLDLLPGVVGSQSAALPDENAGAGLNNGRVSIEPSLNARYSITPSLLAEATLNPDFSQVESDAAQIDVNSTFALFFPERRPFFQEGSDLFETYVDVVYTRSINDPSAAAKTTGRTGRYSLAYLSAVDENSPLLVPLEERSGTVNAGRSFSNIIRARRTFGENSFVGTTITDRRFMDGGSGSLASTDLRVQLLDNYRFEAQLALSNTHEPTDETLSADLEDEDRSPLFDRGSHTVALDGEQFQGNAFFLSFDRNARHWNFDLGFNSYSPTFRTANGFVTRNDYRRLRLWQGVMFYPEWWIVERVEPGMFAMTEYNYDGTPKGTYGELMLWMRLKGQTNVFGYVGRGRERFRDVQFEGLNEWYGEIYSRFSEWLNLGFEVSGGESIYRETPELGKRLNMEVEATIKPLQRLIIEPEVSYASLRNPSPAPDEDTFFFQGYIFRTRASLQFTRELSMRLVVQYNDFDENLSVEPLLSYQINPFSVFYLGTTHGYDRFDDADALDDGISPGFHQTERQLFFKFQYLVRV